MADSHDGQRQVFLSVLEQWQTVDLPNLQLSLDEQATVIAENREDSTASRRALADATRGFKRLPVVKDAPDDSALKTHVPPILKSYQTEIDKLTQRAK
jgi:homeobox protein cut-like